MSGILSWINPLWKIATGVEDLIKDEQARDRIYFNEVYRDHIVKITDNLKNSGMPYKDLSLDEFVTEYKKTDIEGCIGLSLFSNNDTLQQAVRNVCSHHKDAFEKISSQGNNKLLMEYICKWYVEHLYKDYKEREWEGMAFYAWKAIRG